MIPDEEKNKSLATPLSMRGIPTVLVYLMAALGAIYLLNPTAGIFEVLSDNLPMIGNLDEGVAAMLVWYGLLEWLERRKGRA